MTNDSIKLLKKQIDDIKPEYDQFNKKLRLNKEERERKKILGRQLYQLNISLIHEYIKLELDV